MKLKIFAIFGIFLAIGIYFLLNNFNNMTTNNPINKSNIDEKNLKVAYFAGGCFWCMEGIFESQEGVKEAITGYAGGTEETSKYDIVSTGTTKHREAVKVEYDPKIISYEKLVKLFWTQIDPTDEFGQFADKGNQYTTAIFYTNDEEKSIAENSKDNLEKSGKFNKKIATKIEKFTTFFKAEENHQDYYKKSSFKYNLYKKGSGRENFIENNWEKEINNLSSDNISKENLKTKLTPLQYKVTQENGTEKAFQNEYWDNHQDGIYVDIVDGTPLFSSLDKYDSGTGWPSFTKPISLENIKESEDDNWFSRRTEVKSKKSNSHLGHVFTDGPKDKGGLRFCMNSASLRFIPLKDLDKEGYGEYKKLFK